MDNTFFTEKEYNLLKDALKSERDCWQRIIDNGGKSTGRMEALDSLERKIHLLQEKIKTDGKGVILTDLPAEGSYLEDGVCGPVIPLPVFEEQATGKFRRKKVQELNRMKASAKDYWMDFDDESAYGEFIAYDTALKVLTQDGPVAEEYDQKNKTIRKDLKKDAPTIDRMMELSTAHLTAATAALLKDEAIDVPFLTKKEGWTINTSQEDAEEYPDDLKEVLLYAYHQGCEWVLLDSDVEPIQDLPVYEWDER